MQIKNDDSNLKDNNNINDNGSRDNNNKHDSDSSNTADMQDGGNNDVSETNEISLEELQKKYNTLQEEYQELSKLYGSMNEKFKAFVNGYNSLEERCNTLKNDMDKYKQEQRDGAKIEVVEMLLSMHNSLRIVLEESPDIIVLKMMSGQIENLLNAWNITIIAPNYKDTYSSKDCKIIASVDTGDEELKNCISRLITLGYKMNNKLIRAAEVEIFV